MWAVAFEHDSHHYKLVKRIEVMSVFSFVVIICSVGNGHVWCGSLTADLFVSVSEVCVRLSCQSAAVLKVCMSA